MSTTANQFLLFNNSFPSENKDIVNVPGPGSYELGGLMLRASTTGGGGADFANGSRGRIPFDLGPLTPGPATYSINYDPGRPKLLEAKNSSTFVSVSKRESFINNFRCAG